jgi:hypothetical protein
VQIAEPAQGTVVLLDPAQGSAQVDLVGPETADLVTGEGEMSLKVSASKAAMLEC